MRVSNDDVNGEPIFELFAVAVDDDQGALNAFHLQFATYDGAEVVGPLLGSTIARLTLTAGQAAPL